MGGEEKDRQRREVGEMKRSKCREIERWEVTQRSGEREIERSEEETEMQ